MKDIRTAEVHVGEFWVKMPFRHLKKGDVFRLRESTGELAHNGEKYLAISDAYIRADGLAGIDISEGELDNAVRIQM